MAVSKIRADLTSGYIRDFGKYSGKVDAGLIAAIFKAVPSQLSLVLDDSVKRFKFKNVQDKRQCRRQSKTYLKATLMS